MINAGASGTGWHLRCHNQGQSVAHFFFSQKEHFNFHNQSLVIFKYHKQENTKTRQHQTNSVTFHRHTSRRDVAGVFRMKENNDNKKVRGSAM